MKITIDQALQKAIEAHKKGHLHEAEAMYKAILQSQPQHPDANHNLGVLIASLSQTAVAIPLFKIALEADPSKEQFWLSYVSALIKEKHYASAKSVLEYGKKRWLTVEKVEVLAAKLKASQELQNPELTSKKNKPNFKLLQKISNKKERKNVPINFNLNRNPTPIELNTLLKHYENGQNDLARNLAEKLSQQYPNHPFGWKVLASLYKQTGKLEDSVIANQKVVEISPNDAQAYYNLGITLKELGSLEDAAKSYKKAIDIKPDYAQAYSNLGIVLNELGLLEDAERSYKKAIAIKQNYPEAHCNLGSLLKDFGRLEEAEKHYKKAIDVKPDYAQAHYCLGNTLIELGRLEDAEKSYKKAISIKLDFPEAHSNLGNTFKDQGKLEDAEKSYKEAINIQPENAQWHYNLGNTLNELGRPVDAEKSYKKAISINSDFAEAHTNLGVTLSVLGRQEEALTTVIKSIGIKPTVNAKGLFVAISSKLKINTWNRPLSELVITALIEPWSRPLRVMPFAIQLLSKNIDFAQILNQSNHNLNGGQVDDSLLSLIRKKEFAYTPLMQAMLTSTIIANSKLETIFTNLRTELLEFATSLELKEDKFFDVPSLYCSLAQQCFINEYVYFQTQEEIDSSHQLRDQVIKALAEDQSVPSVYIIAVACYFPLYSIEGAKKLLGKNVSDDIYSVLVQQIQEPLQELDLRKSILSLTDIENHVSLKVQGQYEENPYPRWTRLPKDSSKKYLNSYIRGKFPCANFISLNNDKNPEILIAGCGSGQHCIELSHLIKGAKILAIDLSMASLSYAKRKTEELGIESIEYAQADLLNLNSLARTFDIVESSGVLHHLENPFEGWEVLLSLLRPHGLMKLGFYSELARRDIVRVRNLISSSGIGASVQDIRNYRRHLLKLTNSEDYGFATNSADFFSTSACRDLLFHVQEHRMNLRVIDRFLKDHDLNFLGFEIDTSVIQAYKKRFTNDVSATMLDQWHIYEEENPDTFIGMYQFYVQKIS